MKSKFNRWLLSTSISAAILLIAGMISLFIGPAAIPIKKFFYLISSGKGTSEYSIIFDIRLSRIILGFATGGSLSLAGVILQGMFRNPLVEPYTLGISGGAALAVCLNIVLRLQRFGILSLPLSGFLGAVLVIILIYSLSIKKGIFKIQELLLIGVMLSFICSSLIMLIMAISHIENLPGITFWIMGSLQEPSSLLIKMMLGISFFGLLISYLFCLDLNAFSLGEEGARHLGINTEKTKRMLFILSSLITGCSVSVAGIIGFVGLVIPHFMRMLVGTDHRILLVNSFLAGATFLILCDTIARIIILPAELPVGAITGVLGGSLFVYLLTARKQKIFVGPK